MKVKSKQLLHALSWLVIILVAILFTRSLHENWSNLEGISLRPDAYVLVAFVLIVSYVVLSGISWGHITERLTGEVIAKRESIYIHLASWLLKYIPGQTGSLINKLSWAKKRGIDGKKVAASFVYENIFVLLASVVISIPILFVAMSEKFFESGSTFVPLLITLPVALLILMPRVFANLLNSMFRLFKKQRLDQSELLSFGDSVRFLAEFCIPRLINGAAFVLLAISVVGITPSQYMIFAAIYILAGIVGILAIFVPSGLGVREAVIALFASAYIPFEQAIALALIARFYATLADVLIFLLYLHLKPKRVNT